MRSNGGVASAAEAAERPVTLMLSGPAAGVLGAQWAGGLVGPRAPHHLRHGRHERGHRHRHRGGVHEASARDTQIAGYPLLVPMFDIQTIGAGGGSIARVDEAGAFRVGPQSAGADPGPACYGRGGERADDHRRAPRPRAHRSRALPRRRHGARARTRPRAAIDRARPRELGMGRCETAEGVLAHREREHGPDDPLDHGRARARPARLRARRVRRRGPAACGGARRDARHPARC